MGLLCVLVYCTQAVTLCVALHAGTQVEIFINAGDPFDVIVTGFGISITVQMSTVYYNPIIWHCGKATTLTTT